MNLIYQIGRFDIAFNKPVKFKIFNTKKDQVLSSFALKEYLNSQNLTKVVLIYPISLLLNSKLKSWNIPSFFKEQLIKILESSKEKEKFLQKPEEYFRLHPHSKLADYIVIHSIGEYEGVKFSATFDDLVLEIFFDIISRFLEEPFSTLYLDISSGHNIYISALLEAARLFLAFYQLRNWLRNENHLKAYIVFSDPIIGIPQREYQIYTHYNLTVRTFFSAPIIIRKNDYSFTKKLTKENRELKQQFQPFLEKAYFFYSIIKNNIPLALYTFKSHSLKEIDSIIKTFISFCKEELLKTYLKTPNFNRDDLTKALFLLALYYGIVKSLQKYEIYPKKEVSIYEIDQKFCKDGCL